MADLRAEKFSRERKSRKVEIARVRNERGKNFVLIKKREAAAKTGQLLRLG